MNFMSATNHSQVHCSSGKNSTGRYCVPIAKVVLAQKTTATGEGLQFIAQCCTQTELHFHLLSHTIK